MTTQEDIQLRTMALDTAMKVAHVMMNFTPEKLIEVAAKIEDFLRNGKK